MSGAACSGLEEMVAQRKLRIEELKDEVKALRAELGE